MIIWVYTRIPWQVYSVFSEHLAVLELMVSFHALVWLLEASVENVELVDVLHCELRGIDLVPVQDFELLESLGDERCWREGLCPIVCSVPPFILLRLGKELL